MNRSMLAEYLDARAMVEEAEADLRRIKLEREANAVDSVKGSNPNFPYEPRVVRIEGVSYREYQKPDEQKRIEAILTERREKAKRIRLEVDAWMNTIPVRMQRIIRLKYFEELTWAETALRMGGRVSGDAIRMELSTFMKQGEQEFGRNFKKLLEN